MKLWCSRSFQLRNRQKQIVSPVSKLRRKDTRVRFLNFDIGLKLLNQRLQVENECFDFFPNLDMAILETRYTTLATGKLRRGE